ncbi:MAG: PRC-barrel domain-containing protein [Chloroflexota bacterium]|nr:PRC-barrel domain-containing protein [Chloroflexota bacterium]
MTTTPQARELERLGSSAVALADPAEDVRGRTVCDRIGQPIGPVEDIWFDMDHRRARLLEMSHGGLLGLGTRHLLVPVETIRGTDVENVYLDRDREVVIDGPEFEPDQIENIEVHYADVYAWYGVAPYWEAERPTER